MGPGGTYRTPGGGGPNLAPPGGGHIGPPYYIFENNSELAQAEGLRFSDF